MTTLDTSPQIQNSPTIWGLDPVQLHDRFWAARGVQVVRQGEQTELVAGAEIYMLTAPRTLIIFKLSILLDHLTWLQPDVLLVRLHNTADRTYREVAVTNSNGEFVRFRRLYGGNDSRLARVALTTDRNIAAIWRNAPDPRAGWRQLRKLVHPVNRSTTSIRGEVFDQTHEVETSRFVRRLVQVWKRPDSTIRRAVRHGPMVWTDIDVEIPAATTFVGPTWIGAGRSLDGQEAVVGPAALWDEPASRPRTEAIQWTDLEPTEPLLLGAKIRRKSPLHRWGKRVFDIVFSLVTLLLTLPLYPFVMLAIFLEDGRPFFFLHQREAREGRTFPCIKFRSMRKNADRIKASLQQENLADGPQFYMRNDPRLTRVGRFIRKTNIDELPQFINVLLGHMSVVGPRPSPHAENQFCPSWREARLSVHPGVTGLWQIMRSRRPGLDFQEWVRYDIEYVQKSSLRFDLWIIWKTIVMLIWEK
jgi:lipopolysaccharide/colanic/teichoic acid biosynthesis glycosyltransferase